jgi:hypothetical protein
MDRNRLSELAAEIARYVIDSGEVDEEDKEWWITSLGAAVLFEAEVRGYENATEIADEAVRLHAERHSGKAEDPHGTVPGEWYLPPRR